MSLATTKKGDVLLEFHHGGALDIPESDRHIPMPLALIVARYEGKNLFIYNTWRKQWELPGGMIDDGETPQQAAIRELAEESGQQVQSADYIGWMKFRLTPDDRVELAVLYSVDLPDLQPFNANNEASKTVLWDMETPLAGYVNEIDLYLAKLVL